MDSKFRVNTNGERSKEEETPLTAFRRGESQPQMQSSSSSQFQPNSQRSDEQFFNFPNHDLQTLDSSFANLSLTGSTVGQNPYNQPITGAACSARGGGSGGGGGGDGTGGIWFRPPTSACQRQLEIIRMRQRLAYQNNCVNGNGSYGYDTSGSSSSSGSNMMHNNNGFLNENARDFSYPGIGFGCGTNHSWRNNGGFGSGYNHQDPSSSMENERSSLFLWAKDKFLSKQLIERIDGSSKEMFDMIFNNLIVHICELMVDPYGQEVTLHLMPKCSNEQIILIVDVITQHQFQFVNLCFDALGTRAIQLLLECIRNVSEDLVLRILGVIHMIALQLARNSNGKHVITHCFKAFKLPQFRNLLEVIAQNCYHIAIDQHGCCMLQQALQLDCYELRRRIICEIIANALKLCLNCYGNYVVQFIVEMNNPHVIKLLVGQLVGSYGYLSRNKYGSHAVQKLLKTMNVDTRLIVHDLLLDIDTLLLDPFGNYVIQTAWFVSKDDVRRVLRWHIENNIRLMRCSKFGKKVLEKLNL